MSYASLIFENLGGKWCLERSADNDISMHGKAEFILIDERKFLYSENVDIQAGEFQTRSHREFIYRLNGDQIDILYHDPFRKNELLHALNFKNGLFSSHEHECGNDRYGLTLAYQKETVTMDYIVTGPNKNYQMKTILSRFGF